MKEKITIAEVKLINIRAYKETHALYVNGQLQSLGTEAECTFMKLSLLGNRKARV